MLVHSELPLTVILVIYICKPFGVVLTQFLP